MSRRRLVHQLGCALISVSMLISAPCLAGPQIPGFYGKLPNLTPPVATAVPQLKGIVQGVTNVVHDQARNKLTVNQDKDKAILDWHSFDIGQDAWTHFNQRDEKGVAQKDWAALNRIWDKNPSQIYGKLTADGKVFLINQNGILFGPSSRVNVHSLTASSLNIKDEDFISGVLKFKAENYIDPSGPVSSDVAVSNHGVMETDELGEVFLLASIVENGGVILSPVGQTGLVAATEAQLIRDPDFASGRSALIAHVKEGAGVATNFENGWIIADVGLAGMYGSVVNQEGLVRSVTAVKKAGAIELHASERISTGKKSLTSCPVSDSPETVHESFEFNGGRIDLGGLRKANDDISGNLLSFSATNTGRVEHKGVIEAPSGAISVSANDRVYLESGSRIDVGGLWVEKPSEANLVEAQLNSVELRDDYGQKDGLLKGKKINFDALYGSGIGDVSGSLKSEQFTAVEHATKAGSIYVNAGEEIVMKQGAVIDFSGGGVRFGAGHMETTKLLAGREIVDISESEEWLLYDNILGLHKTHHERYGITEEFHGLYTGGANPLRDFAAERAEGSDAGSLNLVAGRIVLDGVLDGSVFKGMYQTETGESENKSGNQNSSGINEPRGGKLVVGVPPLGLASPETQDFGVEEVVIKDRVEPLPAGFGPTDVLPSAQAAGGVSSSASILSAQTLSSAGIGRLEIYANTRLTIDEGAEVSLRSRRFLDEIQLRNEPELAGLAGGLLTVAARRIEVHGNITVSSGDIDLSLEENVTSFDNIFGVPNPRYIPLQQRIYFGEGSVLSVAGERIDNSAVSNGGGILKTGRTEGGHISISGGGADAVILRKGALLDVSGGYEIDPQGKVSGADAGSLGLYGASVVLDGTLRGHSLLGKKGGGLFLGAAEAAITRAGQPSLPEGFTAASVLPGVFANRLILGQSQLSETGFSHISVDGGNRLNVEEGVRFGPSFSKLSPPLPGGGAVSYGALSNDVSGLGGADGTGGDFVQVSSERAGSSSIKLAAGRGRSIDSAQGISLNIEKGAEIYVGPAGTVDLQAPEVVLDGTISAPAGKVSLKANFFDLILKAASRILAGGYNKAETTAVMQGYPVGFTALAGGEVKLEAGNANLILEQGSLVDVSGSDPVTTFVKSAQGKPESFTVAGDPGSLSLSYFGGLLLDGDLRGSAKREGLKGGALAVNTFGSLLVDAEDLGRYQASGFDDLRFTSQSYLGFSDAMEVRVARRLTLDAPEIRGPGQTRIALSSPWIRLINTYSPAAAPAASGQAQLTLSGDWIDVEGQVTLSGFSLATLAAKEDVRLSDRFYTLVGAFPAQWKGGFETPGELTLQAARIYPTTLSQFTIQSGGLVTILPGDDRADRAIPSAGGSLVIKARNIDHAGYLAAPMGQINLEGLGTANSIRLAPGSTTSTAGAGSVNYGTTDETQWTVPDRTANTLNAYNNVETAPEKSVTLSGDGILVEEGAVIDVSGGGKVFAYQFYPAPAGSEDPLKKAGRYVLMPDQSVALPGDAVYLEGGAGLNPDLYSLLPEEYAFLPGALILTDLSESGQAYSLDQGISAEGYSLIKGYATVAGTGMRSLRPKGYSVRRAADVLKEGYYFSRVTEAGDAGRITIKAKTAVVEGDLKVTRLPGYRGGVMSLSADRIIVGQSSPSPGTLVINPEVFFGENLSEIMLGYDSTAANPQDRLIAESVTIDAGSVINASRITLGGKQEIILKSGAEIHAVSKDGNGVASIIAPEGRMVLEEKALVHASDNVTLAVKDIDLWGDIQVDNRSITLAGAKVFFVPDGYVKSEAGLYFTQARWNKFGSFGEIGLASGSDLLFVGDFDLSVSDSLRIDAARIAAAPALGGGANAWNVSINAPRISLLNTGAASTVDMQADTGTIMFKSSDLSIGHGDIRLDGFSRVNLTSLSDVTFKGKGSLTTGGADLSITAPRVTTSFYKDENTKYEAPRYIVNGGIGAVRIIKGAGTPGKSVIPGGMLEINARTIDLSTIVEVNSGQVKFNASGTGASEGIFLKQEAKILAGGSDYVPGGDVTLRAEQGTLRIASGVLIDVSAGGQGDAGFLSLFAPGGGVSLEGSLLGKAANGAAGSFEMDTNRISDFSALNDLLFAGGFNQTISLRARTGNLTISPGQKVASREFKLAADQGNLSVYSEIDVSGAEVGGRVELYAGNLLYLYPEARIYATGASAGAPGGEVFLGTSSGHVATLSGSLIDVSGGDGAVGGTVSLRAPRYESSEVFILPFGTVKGAESVFVEAFKVSSYTGSKTITSADFGTSKASGWWKETDDFMKNASLIESRLLGTIVKNGWTDSQLHLLPGIEVRSTGYLTLASDWDLTSWDFGGEPGALTLRAGGNLNINNNLLDRPTSISSLPGNPGRDSWGLNLAAGADMTGAHPLVVVKGVGDLTLGPSAGGKMVYSESGPVRFSSGRNTVLRPGPSTGYMISTGIRHTLGSYDGTIEGDVGGTLTIRGGAIQTAVSDIHVKTEGDLILGYTNDYSSPFFSLGSIRTTGQHPTPSPSRLSWYWEYGGGGSIALKVGGSVKGRVNQDSNTTKNAWDSPYRTPFSGGVFDKWGASYQSADATEGIVAMAGGDLRVHAGGDFFVQTGTFGKGNLEIYAGGNVDGRFLVKEGRGEIHAMGNFGATQMTGQSIEVFDARIDLTSQGEIVMGTILNPIIANLSFFKWDLQYTQDSSVRMKAVTGDVTLLGDSAFYSLTSSYQNRERVLPPTLEIWAGGDILLSNQFALVPSPTGNLLLEAGGDVEGRYGTGQRSSIIVSDLSPDQVYGLRPGFAIQDVFSRFEHSAIPVHEGDPVPIQISAGRDVRNLQLFASKKTELSAGRDVRDIYLYGQNVDPGDLSLVKAGRDIFFSSAAGFNYDTGILLGGPGALIVQAGNNIDLGTTEGIQTVGSGLNPALGTKGSDLLLAAGYQEDFKLEEVAAWFGDLREAGVEYSGFQAKGDVAAAKRMVDQAREEIIAPYLDDAASGTGNINMIRSQLSTGSAKDDVFVLARGEFNVGKSSFVTEAERKSTGMFTASGGAVSIFSGGDMNVNEARVMTFRGGDITLWSDRGNVNAGRGSKTAINVEPPKYIPEFEFIIEGGKTVKKIKSITRVFEPPAVGSGIRTLTYDPDGIEGPLKEPLAGDVYLFAPAGIIDAGEAGIAGRNVTLGATQVVNAQNISFSVGSVGVPVASTGAVGIGALAGVSSLTEVGKMTEQAAGMASSRAEAAQQAAKLSEDLVAKWLDVKVIGFE